MSDHEFEKRVRQELNDLKITPSGSTWMKIEEGLKQHRRRRPILWIPLVFLGLVAGGYIFLNHPADKPTTAAITKTKPAASKILDSKTVVSPPANAANKNAQNELSRSLPATRPALTSGKIISEKIVKATAPKKFGSATADRPDKSGFLTASSNRTPQAPRIHKTPTASVISPESIAESDGARIAASTDANDPLTAVVDDMLSSKDGHPQLSVDQHNKAIVAIQDENLLRPYFKMLPLTGYSIPDVKAGVSISSTPLPSLLAHSVPGSPILVDKHSKWSYALTASAGSSMITDGRFGFTGINESNVEDLSQAAATPSVNYTPTIPTPGPYTPSKITPGVGYSFGGIVKRQLSKRFSLSAGLNYSRLTTNSTVGEQVNQQVPVNSLSGSRVVTSYFRFQTDQAKEYTNRYHFIELPVTLHTTIFPSRTLPVYWNFGASVSRLLTSNSLFFDGTSGVYYRDKTLINQTQLAAATGFSVGLLNRTKHPLLVGPTLKYHLSRMLKEDVNRNKHIMYVGLDVKWFLKK